MNRFRDIDWLQELFVFLVLALFLALPLLYAGLPLLWVAAIVVPIEGVRLWWVAERPYDEDAGLERQRKLR